jgi:hypothetical protein
MNPTVYSIERNGQTVTVKTCGGPVGAALAVHPDARKGVRWEERERNAIGKALLTIVNGSIFVREIDIPLAWVKWAPA